MLLNTTQLLVSNHIVWRLGSDVLSILQHNTTVCFKLFVPCIFSAYEMKNQLMSLFQFYSYIAGSLHVSGPQAHPQESSHSSSHNHWFSICTALVARDQSGTDTEPMVV